MMKFAKIRSPFEPNFLKEFDPNQERDAHGRWTSGGVSPDAELNPREELATHQAVSRQTMDLMDQAKEQDRVVTPLVQASVSGSGGEMLGLQNRLKTDGDRIAQKMNEKILKEGLTPEQARGAIYDSLRYTAAFPADRYSEGVDKLMKDLQAQGFSPLGGKDKNYWPPPPGIYHGLNYVMVDKNGFKFEMQFHTPESFQAKKAAHKLYETFRTSKDRGQRLELWNKMNTIWSGVKVPGGVDRLGTKREQEQA